MTIEAAERAIAEIVAGADKPLCSMMTDSGDPAWQQIEALFGRHGLCAPHWRLRDEIVNLWSWAKYGTELDARFRTIAEGFAALKAERDEARRTSIGDWANQRENDLLTIEMYDWKARALASEAECERLREALADIAVSGTAYANATVKRMVEKARAALEGKAHD